MQVILLERIEKLGQMGDLVTVKNGYARNFLVPQGKAMRATKANMAEFERRKVDLEAANLKRREEAESVAGKVDGKSVVIIRQAGESGQLYGSVSGRDIAEAFAADGVNFDRRQVRLDQPIKTLGLHDIRVALIRKWMSRSRSTSPVPRKRPRSRPIPSAPPPTPPPRPPRPRKRPPSWPTWGRSCARRKAKAEAGADCLALPFRNACLPVPSLHCKKTAGLLTG